MLRPAGLLMLLTGNLFPACGGPLLQDFKKLFKIQSAYLASCALACTCVSKKTLQDPCNRCAIDQSFHEATAFAGQQVTLAEQKFDRDLVLYRALHNAPQQLFVVQALAPLLGDTSLLKLYRS